jgi:hypothetical protein
MIVIQPPGVQWVVNLPQLKLDYAHDIFSPRVQSQETNVFFLGIHVDDRSNIKHKLYDYWQPTEIFLEN